MEAEFLTVLKLDLLISKSDIDYSVHLVKNYDTKSNLQNGARLPKLKISKLQIKVSHYNIVLQTFVFVDRDEAQLRSKQLIFLELFFSVDLSDF